MSAPEIHKMLTLSTGHLPAEFLDAITCPDVTGWHPWEYGFLVWVPDDPAEMQHSEFEGDHHEAIVSMRARARELGCDWIALDCDGPILDNLTEYEHP